MTERTLCQEKEWTDEYEHIFNVILVIERTPRLLNVRDRKIWRPWFVLEQQRIVAFNRGGDCEKCTIRAFHL
jgi:hypothetical protein